MDMWAELRTKTDVIRSHWWTFLLSLAMGLAGGFVAAGALYSERVEMADNATHYINLVADSGAGVITRAVLELKIGEYEELQVKLLGQSSWRRPSKQ